MTASHPDQDNPLEMSVEQIELADKTDEGFQPVLLKTNRGELQCRYYPSAGAALGAVWVGGVGGGWDTPAQGLYPRLCSELAGEQIASLRVRYRNPVDLEESVLDVLAGLYFLEQQGVKTASLTGWSFGGAVVVQAAAASDMVRTVVTIATQSYGADAVIEFSAGCSILLLHGTSDHTLSPACSQHIHALAAEPKRLVLFENAGHGLDEVAEQVHDLVHNWIITHLKQP